MELPLNTINISDNIEFIKTLPDSSIDAIITDSPYGLGKEPKADELIMDWVAKGYHEIKGKGFMGKTWDAFVPQPALWKECYRVLKPGGYLLSFFGTRTYDWGTLAIRLAGFEVMDCIQWIYATGFPKTKGSIKPANEPIAVCRKPGGFMVPITDDCRIESGRLTANVMFCDEAAMQLDDIVGVKKSGGGRKGEPGKRWYCGTGFKNVYSPMGTKGGEQFWDEERQDYYSFSQSYNDEGGPSRYFYVAKASPSERAGMKHPTIKPVKLMTQLVKLYCPIGGIVLDPHFGTGPTGEACLETGRNFIGIDNDAQSVEEANGRIDRWHKKQDKQTDLFKIAI